jgi:hypothetical protein
MPYGRFVLPVVPLLLCTITAGLWDAVRLARRAGLAGQTAFAGAGLGGVVWLALALDHRVANSKEEQDKVDQAAAQIRYDEGLRAGARLLAYALPPGARLVSDFPGTMAYYTDAYVIDMFGLTTREIAHEGTTEGINPVYGRTCPSCYPRLDVEFFHVNVPIVRPTGAFTNPSQVLDAVWQSGSIGKFMDLRRDFAVGRVVDTAKGAAVYFLERRSHIQSFAARSPRAGITIQYPFDTPG